jgi:hypothetical protein
MLWIFLSFVAGFIAGVASVYWFFERMAKL